jgi:hypothetical protein
VFLGDYTISDLVDLIAAKTTEVQAIDRSLSNIGPGWQSRDVGSYSSFYNDWNALKARWQKALDAANSAITASKFVFSPASIIPAPTEYAGILSALAPGGDTVVSGDLTDLARRLQNAGGQSATSVPQPTATDIDLKIFQASDSAAKSMPSFVKTGIATFAPGLVPQNADRPNYKALPGSPWMYIAGAGAAVIALLRITRR